MALSRYMHLMSCLIFSYFKAKLHFEDIFSQQLDRHFRCVLSDSLQCVYICASADIIFSTNKSKIRTVHSGWALRTHASFAFCVICIVHDSLIGFFVNRIIQSLMLSVFAVIRSFSNYFLFINICSLIYIAKHKSYHGHIFLIIVLLHM